MVAWALFDLDGCLVDSSRTIPAAINAGLQAVGAPPCAPAELQWCIGPPLVDSFTTLLAEAGLHGPEAVALAVTTYRAAYPALSVDTTTVVPGIVEVVAGLAQRRAIVTSKPADFARPLATAMGIVGHFEEVFGPRTDLHTEGKQDTLARALIALDVADPSTAVMIGDRRHDVGAGRAMGTRTIGVTWGAGNREELVAAGADDVVDTPDELAALLE